MFLCVLDVSDTEDEEEEEDEQDKKRRPLSVASRKKLRLAGAGDVTKDLHLQPPMPMFSDTEAVNVFVEISNVRGVT